MHLTVFALLDLYLWSDLRSRFASPYSLKLCILSEKLLYCIIYTRTIFRIGQIIQFESLEFIRIRVFSNVRRFVEISNWPLIWSSKNSISGFVTLSISLSLCFRTISGNDRPVTTALFQNRSLARFQTISLCLSCSSSFEWFFKSIPYDCISDSMIWRFSSFVYGFYPEWVFRLIFQIGFTIQLHSPGFLFALQLFVQKNWCSISSAFLRRLSMISAVCLLSVPIL